VKIVNNETYTFEFCGKTWTMYDKKDAEWLDQQLKDAKRYQWMKENGADAFLAAYHNNYDIDAAIDSARGYLA
jgi:hypothetical protein